MRILLSLHYIPLSAHALPVHQPVVRGAVGRVELGAGRRVPPVAARGPGQRGGEWGEDVEEGPGQDDVVVGPNVHGQHEHRVANACEGRRDIRLDKNVKRREPEVHLFETD